MAKNVIRALILVFLARVKLASAWPCQRRNLDVSAQKIEKGDCVNTPYIACRTHVMGMESVQKLKWRSFVTATKDLGSLIASKESIIVKKVSA